MGTRIVTSPAAIRNAIDAALSDGPRKVAVAFWGKGALETLKLDRRKLKTTKVICNLSVGGCTPEVIRELLNHGADVRALPTLHAKAYIGARAAVIGSANASTGGLGGSVWRVWEEACVQLDAATELDQLNTWFDNLWNKATDMSNPQVASLLLELAKHDQAAAGRNRDLIDLLATLQANPSALDGKAVHVSLDWEPYNKRVEKQVDHLRKEVNPHVDAWENWPKMPASAEILSFYDEPKKEGISFEGIYRTPSDPEAVMDPKTKAIFVVETTTILRTYALGNKTKWRGAVERFRNDLFSGSRKLKDENGILHVSEFAQRYLNPSRKAR